MRKNLAILISAFTLASCVETEQTFHNADTERLYNNLKQLVENGHTLFGQANPTTITYLEKIEHLDISKSDCKDITGSHPAFYESDFMWYRDSVFTRRDIRAMQEAYGRGAVIGYCWHISGINSNSFYSKENDQFTSDSTLVKEIVSNPDRATNPKLNWLLSKIDSLLIPTFNELNCPVVFRPWHEMNGAWFWWGSSNCTSEEYVALFRLTVDYLRKQNIKNLLFAWSPDKSFPMEYYPGDEYVDVLGMDVYEPGIRDYSSWEIIIPALSAMTDYALAHNKLTALTETGCRKSDDGEFVYPDVYPKFWTEHVLNPILNHPKAGRLAWVMSWYGADWTGDQSREAYIPYVGWARPNADIAIDDFKSFIASDKVMSEDELPNMYD